MGKLAGSRVLVTGAAGFIGANLVRRLLAEGASVHALVRPGMDLWRLAGLLPTIHLLECDLVDHPATTACVASAEPDFIYNCAFPGGNSQDINTVVDMLSTGLLGTHALLEAARKTGLQRFIQVGSSTEYHPGSKAHREDDRLEPVTARGVGKAASTLVCRQFAHQHGMSIAILRLFSVYGPMEQANRLVPTACRAILHGETLPLTLPGLMHDWIYVEDVLEACIRAAIVELNSGEIINIGSGGQHTNEEVVHILEEIAGKTLKIALGAHPRHDLDRTHWVADISKAGKLLGWQPGYSLRSGLQAAYAYWSTAVTPDA